MFRLVDHTIIIIYSFNIHLICSEYILVLVHFTVDIIFFKWRAHSILRYIFYIYYIPSYIH